MNSRPSDEELIEAHYRAMSPEVYQMWLEAGKPGMHDNLLIITLRRRWDDEHPSLIIPIN